MEGFNEFVFFQQNQVKNIKSEERTVAPYSFFTDIIVNEEPYESQILNNVDIKQEIIEHTEKCLTKVTFKKVLDDLTRESDDLAKVLDEDVKDPYLHFMTEVSIKREEELNQNLYGWEGVINKQVRIMLTKLKCFMCEHCPAFYKTKKKLLYHIHTTHYLLFRNHVNISKSQQYCSICDKNLTYKLWNSHINIVHSNHPRVCKVCNKVFKHERYLRRHQMYVHENVKPSWRFRNINISTDETANATKVTCPLCSKHFNNKHTLHTHTKNCHGERATCKICHSVLKCKSYLYAHIKRVHYDDGKIYRCNSCHKQFKSPRYLNIHNKNSHKIK